MPVNISFFPSQPPLLIEVEDPGQKHPNGESMEYGKRDVNGYSNLPSRPNSSVDCWGRRPDLLKVAARSEREMTSLGKLPKRRQRPPPPPTPRLTPLQVVDVDSYVEGVEKKYNVSIHRHETPSEAYSRFCLNISTMSKTSMRGEMEKRGLHMKGLSGQELGQRLAVACTMETRLRRLEEALQKGDVDEVKNIRKEKRSFPLLDKKPKVPPRKIDPKYYSMPRHVFLSALQLEKDWKNVPPSTLENAIFVFDCAREWIFLPRVRPPDGTFDARYMHFKPDFLELLSFKEECGMLFWFRPQKSYDKLSEFFSKIQNPMDPDRSNYLPLQTEEFWWWRTTSTDAWRGEQYFGPRLPEPRFVREVPRILSNVKSGAFDLPAVAELICQSNPSIDVWPWFDVAGDDDSESGATTTKKKGSNRSNDEFRRKAKEQERDKELFKLKEKAGVLAEKQELGDKAAAITLQSWSRGNSARNTPEAKERRASSRGGSRGGSRGRAKVTNEEISMKDGVVDHGFDKPTAE